MSGRVENHSLALLLWQSPPDPKSVFSCEGLRERSSNQFERGVKSCPPPENPSLLSLLSRGVLCFPSHILKKGESWIPPFPRMVGRIQHGGTRQAVEPTRCLTLASSLHSGIVPHWANLLPRGQVVNISSFRSQAILVTTTQFCHYRPRTTDKKQMIGHGWILKKTDWPKQAAGYT